GRRAPRDLPDGHVGLRGDADVTFAGGSSPAANDLPRARGWAGHRQDASASEGGGSSVATGRTAIESTSSGVASMLWSRRPCSIVAATTSGSAPTVSPPHAQR